ncbi:hypothetical protein BH23CHL5_BH23CHL5_04990 [soil metagenome]
MTINQNGIGLLPLRMRFVCFGASIVSEIGNPKATSSRAFLSSLAHRGHQVVFLEKRLNSHFVRTLHIHGTRGLAEYDRNFPEVPYRTYDIPSARELEVWLGRESSTADALILLQGTPQAILDGVSKLNAPHLVRLSENIAPDGTSTLIASGGSSERLPPIQFAPAVIAAETGSLHRPVQHLVVLYDQSGLDDKVAEMLPNAMVLSVCGDGASEYQRVTEAELPEWYSRTRVVVILDEAGPGVDQSRYLLPAANGARAVLVNTHGSGDAASPFRTSSPEELLLALDLVAGDAGCLADGTELSEFLAMSRAIEIELTVLQLQEVRQNRHR